MFKTKIIWQKFFNWQVFLGTGLLALSALVYFLHYEIFHDAYHIFYYLIQDIAFVFIQVLLVTIILSRMLGYREKQRMLKKLNMVIGSFFSEVGSGLLKYFSSADRGARKMSAPLIFTKEWSDRDFIRASQQLRLYRGELSLRPENLLLIKEFLAPKRNFLLNLLGNPSLLEHETFTDLLWAIFHLNEELHFRDELYNLPAEDLQHLVTDIQRAYHLLILEWLSYMRHLKNEYPYLYSLAMRTNPYDANARVVIKS
jgi:hypothetical protein